MAAIFDIQIYESRIRELEEQLESLTDEITLQKKRSESDKDRLQNDNDLLFNELRQLKLSASEERRKITVEPVEQSIHELTHHATDMDEASWVQYDKLPVVPSVTKPQDVVESIVCVLRSDSQWLVVLPQISASVRVSQRSAELLNAFEPLATRPWIECRIKTIVKKDPGTVFEVDVDIIDEVPSSDQRTMSRQRSGLSAMLQQLIDSSPLSSSPSSTRNRNTSNDSENPVSPSSSSAPIAVPTTTTLSSRLSKHSLSRASPTLGVSYSNAVSTFKQVFADAPFQPHPEFGETITVARLPFSITPYGDDGASCSSRRSRSRVISISRSRGSLNREGESGSRRSSLFSPKQWFA